MNETWFKEQIMTPQLKKFLFTAAPYWISALIIGIAGMGIIDILTPTTPVQLFNWEWKGILQFLAVCAGFSWVIHGTGFLLVRT